MEQPKLSEKLSLGQKLGRLIDHLQAGGEVKIDGYTWVWLDNYITRVVPLADGTFEHYGINGLAIKCERIRDGVSEPHYIGKSELSIQDILNLVEKITEDDWFDISAGIALRSLNKKR